MVNIFELEQKEYLRQGVVWDNITFSDNKPTLELLVSKPCNLLAMIDEESQFPKVGPGYPSEQSAGSRPWTTVWRRWDGLVEGLDGWWMNE